MQGITNEEAPQGTLVTPTLQAEEARESQHVLVDAAATCSIDVTPGSGNEVTTSEIPELDAAPLQGEARLEPSPLTGDAAQLTTYMVQDVRSKLLRMTFTLYYEQDHITPLQSGLLSERDSEYTHAGADH